MDLFAGPWASAFVFVCKGHTKSCHTKATVNSAESHRCMAWITSTCSFKMKSGRVSLCLCVATEVAEAETGFICPRMDFFWKLSSWFPSVKI